MSNNHNNFNNRHDNKRFDPSRFQRDDRGTTVTRIPEEVQEPVVQEPVVQEPVVQEPVVQESVVQEVKTDSADRGMVSNCKKLNLRSGASKDDAVITELELGTEVIILGYPGTDWYKVRVKNNHEIVGYVMTQFIERVEK